MLGRGVSMVVIMSHAIGNAVVVSARKRFTGAVGNTVDGKAGLRISKAAVIRGISSALGIQQKITNSFNLPRSRLITNVPC